MKRYVSLILSLLLILSNMTALAASETDAALIESYRLISSPVKVTAQSYSSGSPWSTFTNSANTTENAGVIYKVPFPDMEGKVFKNFIFRFSSSFYGGSTMRVMGLSASYDVPNMSYTDEPFKSMWANESNYIISEGNVVGDNVAANYYMNYANITTYANECLANGASFMYILVNSRSTARAFGSHITDTTYAANDLFPYYYYDTAYVNNSDVTPTIETYKAISDPVLITGSTYAPTSPWQTFTNSVSISDKMGVVYRIDLPELNGKEFKNFVFRFGTSYYGGKSMRVMGVPASTDIENLSYTDEPFNSMWANESKYISNAGDVLSETPASNHYINYADLTGYANDCIKNGDKYMYIAVNSSSTAKAFGSNIKDTDYRRYDLFPYYYYSTRDLPASTFNVLDNINSRIEAGKMEHPYIHGSMEKINEIQKNLADGDEWTKYLYEQTKASADSLAAGSAKSYGTEVSQSYSGVESNILTLMTVYFIEGDEKYLNRALDEFAVLQTVEDWTASAQLDNTQTGASVAIAYDWLYDFLTDEQKTWAETVVKDKVLSIAYRLYQDPASLSQIRQENDYMNIVCGRGDYNHNTYNNSNLLVCALALAPKDPTYSAFIISNNLQNVEPYFELVGENGGHEEPIGYYTYTSKKIATMMSATYTALGTMYGYDKHPAFATTSYYPLYMYGAGPFCFGDTGNSKGTFDSNTLYYFAKHTNNISLMGVLASRFEIGGCVNVLLWYDKGELDAADTSLTLPLDANLYPSTHGQNIAAFRDNWDIDKGFYTAMYTGCASSNGHADAVSGSFTLDAFGERFVTPIGLGDYNYTNYWDHAQDGGRWVWYEKRPEGANCLVINPSEDVGQRVDKTAIFDRFETSDGTSYAVTDLSEVYADNVIDYKRGMMVHKNRSRIVVQDEATMISPSEIFWSINTEANIEIVDNKTAILTSRGKKVIVKVDCNVDYTLYKMKAEKLPTSPQNSLQRKYPGFSKLAISADDVTNLMLSVEFIPLANEYEFVDEEYEAVALSQWTTSDTYEEKPTLGNIYLDSVPLSGFESDQYNYEITVDKIGDTLPNVTFDNPNGHVVDVVYPEKGKVEIVIEVKGATRSAWYTLVFKQTQTNLATTSLTLGTSYFKAAAYVPTDPDSTGTSESKNYLYASGNFGHYYGTIDISKLANKTVTSAVYRFYISGSVNITVYEVHGTFVPGTTRYADLPDTESPLGSFGGSSNHYELDMTDYINRALSEGKTTVGFAVIQNSKSTAWIAGETATSSYQPRLITTYHEKPDPIVISDVVISGSGKERTATIKITNNTDLCYGDYIFYGATYNGKKVTDVAMSETLKIMPYRTKELTISLDYGNDMRFFVWEPNCKPVDVNFD